MNTTADASAAVASGAQKNITTGNADGIAAVPAASAAVDSTTRCCSSR